MSNFFYSALCKNNINYGMGIVYIIVANILIYYVLVYNIFELSFGQEKAALTFILYMFAEFVTLTIARCICISGEKPKDNLLLYSQTNLNKPIDINYNL